MANVRKIQDPKQRLIFKGTVGVIIIAMGAHSMTIYKQFGLLTKVVTVLKWMRVLQRIIVNTQNCQHIITLCVYSALKHLPNATSPPSFRPAFPRQPMFIVLALDVVADDAIYPLFSRAVVARACNTCGELRHFDDWAKPCNILRQPIMEHRRASFLSPNFHFPKRRP